MTIEETAQVMDVLKTAYPQFYSGKNAPDQEKALTLWAAMFDEPVELVAAAVKALIATKTDAWPPSIGEVKERIRRITQPDEMTEAEAWALVLRGIKRSSYGFLEEFRKLPQDLQRVVGSPSQLRDWSQMDEAAVQSVVASNVQRSYRAIAQSRKDFDAMPEGVKAFAVDMARQRGLVSGETP